MTEERRREINEAVRAGERALSSLRAASDKLSGARNWGILDIMGGGLITNMIKHSKINDASSYIENAKSDLRIFQRELRDIPDFASLGVEIGDFLSFADFFFDGLVADFMVQSKIRDARQRVDDAIIRVESLLRNLRSCY